MDKKARHDSAVVWNSLPPVFRNASLTVATFDRHLGAYSLGTEKTRNAEINLTWYGAAKRSDPCRWQFDGSISSMVQLPSECFLTGDGFVWP